MKGAKFLSHGSSYFRSSIKAAHFILDTKRGGEKKK